MSSYGRQIIALIPNLRVLHVTLFFAIAAIDYLILEILEIRQKLEQGDTMSEFKPKHWFYPFVSSAAAAIMACSLCSCFPADQKTDSAYNDNASNTNVEDIAQNGGFENSNDGDIADNVVDANINVDHSSLNLNLENGNIDSPVQPATQASSTANNIHIHHVAALIEPFAGNTLWCAPMQICWNNAMDWQVDGVPVGPFQGASSSIEALNARSVSTSDIRSDYYYSYGKKVEDPDAAYNEINRDLQAKFNETSGLLTPDIVAQAKGDILLYSMLFHKFTYRIDFSQSTQTHTFGAIDKDNYSEHVEYFGIYDAKHASQGLYDSLAPQLDVLYHDDDDNCAMLIRTEENDSVIVVKNPQGATGAEMLSNAMDKAAVYDGNRNLVPGEKFEVPHVDFTTTESFSNLVGASNARARIMGAMQRTEFMMDESGGKAKSEAYIDMALDAEAEDDPYVPPENPPGRNFVFDDAYAVFLVDASIHPAEDFEHAVPYLALLVNDISEIQPGAVRTNSVSPQASIAPSVSATYGEGFISTDEGEDSLYASDAESEAYDSSEE